MWQVGAGPGIDTEHGADLVVATQGVEQGCRTAPPGADLDDVAARRVAHDLHDRGDLVAVAHAGNGVDQPGQAGGLNGREARLGLVRRGGEPVLGSLTHTGLTQVTISPLLVAHRRGLDQPGAGSGLIHDLGQPASNHLVRRVDRIDTPAGDQLGQGLRKALVMHERQKVPMGVGSLGDVKGQGRGPDNRVAARLGLGPEAQGVGQACREDQHMAHPRTA